MEHLIHRALPLLALLGCGGTPATAPSEFVSPPAVVDQAPSAPQVDAVQAMLGTWRVELTEAQRAETEALKLVLREPPPTLDEIDAMGLPPKAENMVKLLLLTRAKEGGLDPALAHRIGAMAERRVQITATEIILGSGEMVERSAYSVADVQGTTVRVVTGHGTEERKAELVVTGPDSLRLTQGGGHQRTMELVRTQD